MSDDYSESIHTAGEVTVGGSAAGNIETAGDRDWFAVELVAGRTYQIDLRGSPTGDGTLSDTFLRRILDAEGNKSTGDGSNRTYNDNFGDSVNSPRDLRPDRERDILHRGLGRPRRDGNVHAVGDRCDAGDIGGRRHGHAIG